MQCTEIAVKNYTHCFNNNTYKFFIILFIFLLFILYVVNLKLNFGPFVEELESIKKTNST